MTRDDRNEWHGGKAWHKRSVAFRDKKGLFEGFTPWTKSLTGKVIHREFKGVPKSARMRLDIETAWALGPRSFPF